MKSNLHYTKKAKQIKISQYPKLLDLLVDIAIFTNKWTGPAIADSVGITKQALRQHVIKELKEELA